MKWFNPKFWMSNKLFLFSVRIKFLILTFRFLTTPSQEDDLMAEEDNLLGMENN